MAISDCNRHPGTRADFRCVQCSKPVCSKCIVNERFCSEACNQKYATFYQNYRKPGDTSRSGLWSVIIFVAVLACAYFAAKKFGYLPW